MGAGEVAAILSDIETLEGDQALLEAIRQRSFVERGLALVDGRSCPLCDVEWEDEEHLRTHLQTKLTKSEQAEAVQKHLLDYAAVIAGHARRITALLAPVHALALSESPTEFAGGPSRMDGRSHGVRAMLDDSRGCAWSKDPV